MKVKDIREEVSSLSDKYIVVFLDGSKEKFKHTDLDSVISSLEFSGITEIKDIFDI